ncbi:hypothetical protein QA641_39090 [Bradyrhizobium sp. CB1650]|nr:hypothetical protein [Bradyrhizobium sp. CB1650]WGD51399.1 hypothetical protein QA641_39090 [Bradyrhizobium sp. CB1650]
MLAADAKDENKSPGDARKIVSDALQDDRFADQPEARNNCVRVTGIALG